MPENKITSMARLRMVKLLTCNLLLVVTSLVDAAQEATVDHSGNVQVLRDEKSHGIDTSWPMQRLDDVPVHRRQLYDEYMGGCRQWSEYESKCDRWESDRISMNTEQPQLMRNYTHAGYAKVDAPEVVRRLLGELWEKYESDKVELEEELWEPGNTYVNHWESPTYMLDVNKHLPDPSVITKAVQPILEAWTQQSLTVTSLYGVRVYSEGSVLAPHVDRLPLVSSAIINVAQDVEEPWFLEVIGHDGRARNLTIGPGEMVLYESHSVIHGRPFALEGEYFANVFVHFEPLGHTIRHEMAHGSRSRLSTKDAFQQALENHHSKQSERIEKKRLWDVPPYVPEDMEVRWKQNFEFERNENVSPKPTKKVLGRVNPHHAAAGGLLDVLKELAEKDRSQLFKKDYNGWRPLHEAARAGKHEVLEYLLEEGAQVNERTNDGSGGTALWWAEKKPERNKKAIEVLKKYGGVSIPADE